MQESTPRKQTPVRKIDNTQQSGTQHWLDKKNSTPFIVACLFIVTLIAYVIIICVKGNISDNTLSGMKDLLLVLGSVFTGTQLRK